VLTLKHLNSIIKKSSLPRLHKKESTPTFVTPFEKGGILNKNWPMV
jgi:hypothetical protein